MSKSKKSLLKVQKGYTEEQKYNLVSFCEEGKSRELDILLNELEDNEQLQKGELQKTLFIDSDGNERTLLHIACANGDQNTVTVLLNHNFSPKTLDDEGNTSLHTACYADSKISEDIVKLLLSRIKTSKTDFINITNNSGDTALYNALWIKSPVGHEIVKLLVNAGADINLSDGCLKPLWACFQKNMTSEIDQKNFKYLLDHGADYLCSDDTVGNAMHRIASQGDTPMAKILYEKAKQDGHLVELFSKSHEPLYEGKNILSIAKDSRNADRTDDFQKWYTSHKSDIQSDIQSELMGDI